MDCVFQKPFFNIFTLLAYIQVFGTPSKPVKVMQSSFQAVGLEHVKLQTLQKLKNKRQMYGVAIARTTVIYCLLFSGFSNVLYLVCLAKTWLSYEYWHAIAHDGFICLVNKTSIHLICAKYLLINSGFFFPKKRYFSLFSKLTSFHVVKWLVNFRNSSENRSGEYAK